MEAESADSHSPHRLFGVSHCRGRYIDSVGQEVTHWRDFDKACIRIALGIGRHPFFQLMKDVLVDISGLDYPGPAVERNGRVRQPDPWQENNSPLGEYRHGYMRIGPDVPRLP